MEEECPPIPTCSNANVLFKDFFASKYAPPMGGAKKNICSHFGIGGKSSSYLVAPAFIILL